MLNHIAWNGTYTEEDIKTIEQLITEQVAKELEELEYHDMKLKGNTAIKNRIAELRQGEK